MWKERKEKEWWREGRDECGKERRKGEILNRKRKEGWQVILNERMWEVKKERQVTEKDEMKGGKDLRKERGKGTMEEREHTKRKKTKYRRINIKQTLTSLITSIPKTTNNNSSSLSLTYATCSLRSESLWRPKNKFEVQFSHGHELLGSLGLLLLLPPRV